MHKVINSYSWYLSHCYNSFLCVLVGNNVKHVCSIAIDNSVFKLCIPPSVCISGFYTSNGSANWGGFWNAKVHCACEGNTEQKYKKDLLATTLHD